MATGFGNKTTATAAGRDVAASLNCTQDAAIDIVECLNKIPTNIIKDSSGMTQLPSVVGAELLPQYAMLFRAWQVLVSVHQQSVLERSGHDECCLKQTKNDAGTPPRYLKRGLVSRPL